MSLPRYPAYKDSGVAWLGEVPGHWEVKPIKAVASCNDAVLEESTPEDFEIEYVEISGVESGCGITSTEIMPFGKAPSRARRRVADGDVLVSTVRTYLRAIAPVINPPSNLIASTGFAVVRARMVVPHYLGYIFQAEYLISEVIARSVGVSYPAINASELMRLNAPIPSEKEQQTIAAFLDRETGKIDALIAEQRRLVELLAEKRQAVISHAVTKGLPSTGSGLNARMKDSGIEWLGEVPEHWNVGVKLKTLAQNRPAAFTNGPFGSDLLTSELQEDGVPVIYIRDLKVGGYRRTSASCVTAEKAIQLDKFRVDAHDILIAKVGDPPGFCCTYPESEPSGIICQDVIRMKPNLELISSDYLCFLLNSTPGIEAIDSICVELTRKRFSLADLHSLRVPLPPRAEQEEIAQHLTILVAEFDALTAEANRAIALLQERRSALISAAVTGKIDVRGAVIPAKAGIQSNHVSA